ncbi:MAG: metallophosphoesterase [Pseudomonadota bacterium]
MASPFSFLGRSTPDRSPQGGTAPVATGPRPDRPTYVVGDLHGRADLLEPLLRTIDADIAKIAAVSPHLVFVGNYIDHGPDSARLLTRLSAMTVEYPDNVVCLMGNHERMLLDFLADPGRRGARWLRNGGAATLRSFGVEPPPDGAGGDGYDACAKALLAVLPKPLWEWIGARPLIWNTGNLWAVHAAADPEREMAAQSARVLLWGHPDFAYVARRDGAWVVHGHTEVASGGVNQARISVDTGAWRTGRLTAAAIRLTGEVEFLTADG